MKLLNLLFVFLFFGLTTLQAQIIPSSCQAADSIVDDYFPDATQLALRKIFEENLPEKDSVEISPVLVDTFLNGMIAVYNIDIPERDSVVDIYAIHARRNIPMGNVRALIDSNFSITDPILDSLMIKFGITSYFQTIGNNNYALFNVDEKYNINPLISVIKSVNGVINAYASQFLLIDNNIKKTINNDHIELIYSIGWGDCMSGCMYHRYWKFKAYYDCSVEFVESYGSSNPPSLKLEKESSFEGLNLFPNPSENELIFALNENFSNIRLDVYDVSGKPVKSIQYSNQGDGGGSYSIDISQLNSGLYFCKFSNGEKSVIKKFVKK